MIETLASRSTLQQRAALDEVRMKVLEYLSIQDAPEEKQDEVLAQLGETAMLKIFSTLMERLDEAGLAEYDTLLERKASEEEIDMFLRSRISDYDDAVRQTIDELMRGLVAPKKNEE